MTEYKNLEEYVAEQGKEWEGQFKGEPDEAKYIAQQKEVTQREADAMRICGYTGGIVLKVDANDVEEGWCMVFESEEEPTWAVVSNQDNEPHEIWRNDKLVGELCESVQGYSGYRMRLYGIQDTYICSDGQGWKKG